MLSHFSKKELLILAITAVALTRIAFQLFNDPEGPNLLIVVVGGAVVYVVSLILVKVLTPFTNAVLNTFWLGLMAQILLLAVFYVLALIV